MMSESILKCFFIVSIFIALAAANGSAQGTNFNFQGRLNDGANPANGSYDLQFRLFNAITGGAPVGAVASRPATVLINGVFSTTLDFGATAFNSPNNVFIEISVKRAGSPNAFTILGPRQQLTAVPFAIRATNADIAQNAVNAGNAVNAINAENASTAGSANTALNALSLGGVPPGGDYTGDGKTDIAVFRPSNGWYILRSEDASFFSFPFGASGDVPSPGDYDGDGRADAAVFRPSNNTWFLNRTTAGIGIVSFGSSGDRPIPNAFVP